MKTVQIQIAGGKEPIVYKEYNGYTREYQGSTKVIKLVVEQNSREFVMF